MIKKFKKKMPRMIHPVSIERLYMKRLSPLIDYLKELNDQIILPIIPGLLSDYDKLSGIQHKRTDSYSDDLSKKMLEYRNRFYGKYTDDQIKEIAGNIETITNDFNKKQVAKMFTAKFSKDVWINEKWKSEVRDKFISDNLELVKSVSEKYLPQLKQVIDNGIKTGKNYGQIADDISERVDVAESNAFRIARDQVSKYTGELDKLRQTSVGVEEYVWRTMQDDRVRDEHTEREGQIFRWDDPPEDGHPKEAINCRCWAEPVIPGQEEE